jgi:6-pyruvoyltetrahydropterin/6-carboxytetrahydropterin synthase
LYALSLQRRFEAWHHLIGGDWGAENQPHTHDYKLELRLEGPQLDQHGYLVDLVEVERQLEAFTARWRGVDLNAAPEFAGLNPSLEHFARIAAEALAAGLGGRGLAALTVRLWENETAWASYRLEL